MREPFVVRSFLICSLLLAATFAVFSPVCFFPFSGYDDHGYIYDNPNVRSGLTWENAAAAFTHMYLSSWHPLAMLSHMLDVTLFGLSPGAHHAVNLLLHLGNTALLFVFLRRATGAVWRTAIVAGLFALHPLHVEPVAWISSRKDVLSTFFLMLTMLAYLRYVKRPTYRWYGLVMVLAALGLLSKPMLVTLPLILLLVDYWPLGRFASCEVGVRAIWARGWFLIKEKIPIIALAGAMALATLYVQSKGGAVRSLDEYSVEMRLTNVAPAYVTYLWKTVWPLRLGAFYPHPGAVPPLWHWGGALLLLGVVTVIAISMRKRRPSALMGWLWFLGVLFPVMGIANFGLHLVADRYMYVPLIGLLAFLVWAVPVPLPEERLKRGLLGVGGAALLVILGVLSMRQVWLWQDTNDMVVHSLRVTNRLDESHTGLGIALYKQGRLASAIEHLKAALELDPQDVEAWYCLGLIHRKYREPAPAVACFENALDVQPDRPEVHQNLAAAYYELGDIEQATLHVKEALRLKPDDERSQRLLESIEQRRDPKEGIRCWQPR